MKKNYSIRLITLLICCFTLSNLLATDYYLKSTGFITNASSWGTNTDGTGTAPSNFNGTHTWHFDNRATASMVGPSPAFSVTATVIVEGGTNLTVSSAGVINSQIDIAASGTLTISNGNTFNLNTLDVASTVVFNSASAMVKAASYGNVTINVNTSLSGSGTFNIFGTLTLNSARTLSLNALTLYLNGAPCIAGTGSITADNSAIISFAGGNAGNNGTLTLAAGSQTINSIQTTFNTGTDYFVMGSDITIANTGLLFQIGGGIDLNGKKLTVDNTSDASFPAVATDGAIRGSSTSALEIAGTIGANGGTDLFMDASHNNLGGLIINSAGGAMGLGNALNIIDSVSVADGTLTTNGFLTIKATSSKAGRISEMGAGGAISGNVTVESYFAGTQPGWAMIGSNGVSGMTVANLDAFIDMTCENCTYGVTSLGSYFESIQGWDEPGCGYDTTITSSTALTPGKGFWVYLSNGFSSTTDMNWSFTGPVVQGPVSIACTSLSTCGNSGYNIVANPYACPISWDDTWNNIGTNSSNFGGTAYLYERNTTNTPEWNAATHTGNNGGTDFIAAGQGFGVFHLDAFNATQNLDFAETSKTHLAGNPNQLMRSAAKNGSNTKPDYIHLRVTGQYDTDQASVVLHNSATTGLDKYDSQKQFKTPGYGGGTAYYNQYTSISTLEKNSQIYLSTNTFPQSNTSYTIPVLVRVSTSGSYTIIAEDFENYSSCAVLRDKLTNSYTDLKLNSYVCNISDTANTPRFELIVCESGGGSTSIKDLYASQNVSIGQDQSGPLVKTFFDKPTDAVISVYNMIGQKLVADIKVNGTETITRIDNLNINNQVVIIKVTADNKSVTKKLIIE